MKLLQPMTIKNYTFKNRVVMPPMCMYSVEKEDGIATPFHFAHYVNRAIGGVGYIIVESTAVLPNGRISMNDLGIWSDDQIPALKRIVDEVKPYGAKIGIQINHAGRKARVNERIVSTTDEKFLDTYDEPVILTEAETKKIINAFGMAANRANLAGFDALEIHGAHGYLINQFLSPLTNKLTNQYSDGFNFLTEIIAEVKKYWPKEKILQIRISAYEYSEEGLTPYDWASLINNFKDDLDLVNVSSGGNIPAKVNDFPGYQLDYARIIKEETNLPVIAGGQLESLVFSNGLAEEHDIDMIYFGRKLLRDPYFLYDYDKSLIAKQYVRLEQLKKAE
ncbi:NADPH dehydrogenase [Acholeplasma equirhinis]|uniref:oxidoreductase n=1 Tax=Acholeplasma equirhinis TaxID=555393 RepID=UPI00197AACEA|nr:NADPH dehydrogenase [Acholeplasma equirhinis]MBN3489948.1 NADPH dehydrogenase [Acholeplasma equirhinis]